MVVSRTRRLSRPAVFLGMAARQRPVLGQFQRKAGRAEAPNECGASAKTPDLVHLFIVATGLDAESLGWIRFDLPKTKNHLLPIACNHDNLPVGDANELVGIRRLRVLPRFFIDFA